MRLDNYLFVDCPKCDKENAYPIHNYTKFEKTDTYCGPLWGITISMDSNDGGKITLSNTAFCVFCKARFNVKDGECQLVSRN